MQLELHVLYSEVRGMMILMRFIYYYYWKIISIHSLKCRVPPQCSIFVKWTINFIELVYDIWKLCKNNWTLIKLYLFGWNENTKWWTCSTNEMHLTKLEILHCTLERGKYSLWNVTIRRCFNNKMTVKQEYGKMKILKCISFLKLVMDLVQLCNFQHINAVRRMLCMLYI